MMKCFPLLIVLFFVSGCSFHEENSSEENDSSITINLREDPKTLDPRQAQDTLNFNVLNALYEGLFRLNPQEQLQAAVAERYEVSEDLKTYHFFLRPTLWSDGTALTAEDFAYSWKSLLEPNFPSSFAHFLYPIKNAQACKQGKLPLNELGIEVIQTNQLKVTLEDPTPYFLELLTTPPFFPVHKNFQANQPLISNGPFSLIYWKNNDELLLKKSSYYWDQDTVQIEQIKMIQVDESLELAMFEKNLIDWSGSPISNLPSDALKHLKNQSHFLNTPALGTHFYRFNTSASPFHKQNMRRAFCLALDRDKIVTHVTKGGQIPALSFLPPAISLQTETLFKDNSQQEAKRLFSLALEEMGIQKSELPPIVLTYKSGDRSHKIAQAVQQQWNHTFGIEVLLEALEAKAYYHKRKNLDFQIADSSWIGDFKDPTNFLEIFKYRDLDSNGTSWESDTFIRALDLSQKAISPHERSQNLLSAENLLMEEMPIAPLFFYNFCSLKSPRITQVLLTQTGILDFKWAQIEKKQ